MFVKPNGSNLWQQRCHFLGREKVLSHGKYPEVGLAMAREKRDKAKAMLAEGKDPAALKKPAIINAHIAHRTTFKLLAEELLEQVKD